MISNDNFQKVKSNFIDPLSDIYGKTLNDAQIDAFVEDLGRFTKSELIGAQLVIRRKNKYFPTISESMTTCESLRERDQRGNVDAGKNPWKEKNDARKKMISDYLAKFQSSSLWVQAVREKWDMDLWRYAYAVADVQAQMIQGLKNIGWNSADIFGINTPISEEEKAAWFKNQRVQCQGGIDVSVPTGKIMEWSAK